MLLFVEMIGGSMIVEPTADVGFGILILTKVIRDDAPVELTDGAGA